MPLYPDPNESEEPGTVEYRRLMNVHFPGKELNRYSLYGYAFGMLVVEGLERAARFHTFFVKGVAAASTEQIQP